jgi:tetratricopeptide (TPR) repeat protein
LSITGTANTTEAEVPALTSPVTVTATEAEITLPSTSTLKMMHSLADTYRDQKKYSEAEKLLKETIEGQKKVFGPEVPAMLSSMNLLGRVYYENYQFAEAEELFKETIEGQRKVLGPEDPITLKTTALLATTYTDNGKWA